MALQRERVLLVHGLYTHGAWMMVLARRLRQAGYATLAFSYPSVRSSLLENAHRLAQRVQGFDAPVLHFVGHSLGGLVIRYLVACFSDLPPGRIVTLGTPHQGSYTARALRARGFRHILGRGIEQGLLEDLPPWPAQRELGSVAGTFNVGLGRLLAGIPNPSDGAVAVNETRLPGMTDHICLPVSHTGLLFAPSVALQVVSFLAAGRFNHFKL